MPSNTNNVNVGVCMVIYDGIDLGYTKGGVEVEVSSDTYESNVDQFGKTAISETINKRSIKAKFNLAETTLENLLWTTPGATMVAPGGVKASGTITVATNPTNLQTMILNGVTITFKTAATGPYDITIGANAAATAAAINTFINACMDPRIALVRSTVNAAVVTLTYRIFGTEGNAYSLNAGTAGAALTLSGATLASGAEPTSKRVDVTDAVGTSLLAGAKELRLHPQELPIGDRSKDLVIPKAATAGGLNFAYKLEEERVYAVEMTGYPDSTTRLLYRLGE